jgi:hypothetical protein
MQQNFPFFLAKMQKIFCYKKKISIFVKTNFMDDLQIKETQKNPRIIFRKSGEFKISGNSFLENAEEFYEPIIQWLENYTLAPAEKTVIHFEFNYYNTTSQLWIYRILENLADLKKIGKKMK